MQRVAEHVEYRGELHRLDVLTTVIGQNQRLRNWGISPLRRIVTMPVGHEGERDVEDEAEERIQKDCEACNPANGSDVIARKLVARDDINTTE